MSPLRRRPVATRPLSCREVGRILQRYLDGQTDELAAERVAEHLDDCRRCGLEAAVYAQIKEALARRGETAVPDDAVARLRQFGQQLANGELPGGELPDGDEE